MTMREASFFQMEDEYIDIELASYSYSYSYSYSSSSSSSSSSSFKVFSDSINSPPQTREFEFQVMSVSLEPETTTSPADELFYKGKLLPLHLPPRLLMVEKLVQNSTIFEETYLLPFTTPDSSTIYPVDSRRGGSELNPDEYRFDWKNKEPFWFKKLIKIKKSALCKKLKVPREYFKTLFRKTCRSHEIYETTEDFNHRKSFSGVIQRVSPSSSSSSASSSFSFSSNGFSDLQLLKRCSSASSEVERSIEGAIAHCKQSQRLFCSPKREIAAEISLPSDSKTQEHYNKEENRRLMLEK